MLNLNIKKDPKISKQNVLGKKITIKNSTNKNLIGLQGIIVNETKNTFDIISKAKRKRIIKSHVDFIIEDQNKLIRGKTIIKKLQDRLKSLR